MTVFPAVTVGDESVKLARPPEALSAELAWSKGAPASDSVPQPVTVSMARRTSGIRVASVGFMSCLLIKGLQETLAGHSLPDVGRTTAGHAGTRDTPPHCTVVEIVCVH